MRILKLLTGLLACALVLPGSWSCKKPEEIDGTVHVKEVNLSEKSITIGPGAKYTLTATIKPKNATNQNLMWDSKDPTIATVDNGVVTGVKDGVTTVFASALDGFITGECAVTVRTVNAQSITLDVSGELMMTIGQTRQLNATMKPDDATVGMIFKSSKPEVASVSDAGLVTAKSAGKTSITVKSADGKASAYVNIAVYKEIVYPTSIDIIFPADIQINKNYILKYNDVQEADDYKIVFHPDNATVKNVRAAGANTNILYVQKQLEDEGGNYIVTGKSLSTSELCVEIQTGANDWKSFSKAVHVWPSAPSITIDMSDKRYWDDYWGLILFTGGKAYPLNVTFNNITDRRVDVTKPDNLVTVSSGLTVTARSKDANNVSVSDIILTSVANPGVSATFRVTGEREPNGIIVTRNVTNGSDISSLNLGYGSSYELKVHLKRGNNNTCNYFRGNLELSSNLKSRITISAPDEPLMNHVYTLKANSGSGSVDGTLTVTCDDFPTFKKTINIHLQ